MVQTSVVLLESGSQNQDVVNLDDNSRDSFKYFREKALKDFRAGTKTKWNPVTHVPIKRSSGCSGSCQNAFEQSSALKTV